MKSLIKIGAAGAALALLLAGCASADTGSTEGAGDDPFEYLFIGGTTGPTASIVNNVILGIQTQIDIINDDGGINGQPIHLSIRDSKGDPTQAVTQLQAVLSSGDTPDLVYPGVSSAESLALLPLLTENNIWSMGQTASPLLNKPADYPYHFGISVDKTTEIQSGISEPLKELKPKVVGIFTSTDALGDAVEAAATPVIEDLNAKVVVERFDPAGVDYTVQIQRLLASNPDVIFADFTGGEPTVRMFAALEAAGALDTPLWIGSGVLGGVSPTTVASDAQLANCSMPTVYSFSVRTDPVKADIEPLGQALLDSGRATSIYISGLGFDVIKVAAEAANLSKDGDYSGSTMQAILEKETINSVLYGDLKYSADSHFPDPIPDTYSFAPCTSQIDSEGFWVTN